MFDQEDEYTSLMESFDFNEDELFDSQEFLNALDTNDIPF